MDNIDKMMLEAERLGFGVSYGKYRAAYPNGTGGILGKAPPEPSPKRDPVPCKRCGKSFIPIRKNEKYCSDDCRGAVKREYNLVYKREYYHSHKQNPTIPADKYCEECGATIPASSKRKKFCCEECAKDGNRKLVKSWQSRKQKGG